MPGTRTPIAFPLRSLPAALHAPESTSPGECIRVSARALAGMQKEAFVSRGRSAPAWRLLCDEGPYLDGSDLAPPPLAYFAAGMAAHHAALILEDAQGSGLESGEWSMLQETRYTMEGSALRGTMKGGALPTGLTLVAGTGDAGTLQRLAEGALRQSVAEALMATAFSGVFSIRHNGTVIRTGRVPAASDSPRGFHPR